MPECVVCGKKLTPDDNDEDCPGTPYRHGKHAVVVLEPLAWCRITNIAVPEGASE